MEKEVKIAFQGSYGANSDLACRKFYPNYKTTPCATFKNIFTLVENGEVDYGILPLENSSAGRVSEIHLLLQDSNVSIVAEHFLKIKHNIVGLKNSKISDIKEIYSHPQALMQCKDNLDKYNFSQRGYSNTADAARYIKKENNPTKAAICSELAANLNDLEILVENAQDKTNENYTLWVVIAKEGIDPDLKKGKIITTMLFTVRNIPGSLYKALGGFATNQVNMLKLESYIPGGISSQAKFFISVEGHPSERKVSLSLEEMGFFSKSVKVLGVYYADKIRF